MGQNSTEVAYGFGQMGSAYSGSAANKITAPHGMVIIAIQFLADNTLDELTAETPANAVFPGYTTVAHAGTTSDTTTEATATIAAGTAITMTTDYSTKGYAVGWYADGIGIPYGTKVTAVDVGSDEKEIKLDGAFVNTNGQTMYFTNPATTGIGTGGEAFTTGIDTKFPKGATIYGRWVSVTPETDDDGGIICYFGK
jgi:hypothetical protein